MRGQNCVLDPIQGRHDLKFKIFCWEDKYEEEKGEKCRF